MGSWFLLRHGETDWKLHGRIQVDCTALSVIGNQPNGRALELWNDTGRLASTGGGAPA